MKMLLIKNCKILRNGTFEARSILIDDGKITSIVAPSAAKVSDETIDAKGKVAIPGLIDVHVHCREPGLTVKEDFRTASMAAAAGGVTTFLDMPNNIPPITTVKLLDEKRKVAAKKSVVNYGFYLGATPNNLDEINKANNIAGVKVYMGSSTGDLLVSDEANLKEIFSAGRMIAAHSENDVLIKQNEKKFANEKSNIGLHLKIRNNNVAASSTERAVRLAKENNARLHVCHVSTAEEVAIIRKAKNANIAVSCEVTPHHLFLSADKAIKIGNFAKVNPPVREKKDVAALWNALDSGLIDMVATDHAPHLKEEKEKDYWHAPSGMPGLETMLPLLLDAVNKGRLQLSQLISLTSENPAKVFGMGSKGFLEKGFDADITLIDLDKEKTIKNDSLFTKCGWSVFDSWKLKGSVSTTIVNGTIVYDGSGIAGKNGKEVIFNGD